MFANENVIGPETHAKTLDANHDSLLYVLDQYFHPQVICAEPNDRCGRIGDTITFLQRNLQREEALMQLSGYPDAEAHIRDHESALRKLEQLEATLVCSHYDNGLVASFIESWADDHATTFDKSFSEFLKAHPKG